MVQGISMQTSLPDLPISILLEKRGYTSRAGNGFVSGPALARGLQIGIVRMGRGHAGIMYMMDGTPGDALL